MQIWQTHWPPHPHPQSCLNPFPEHSDLIHSLALRPSASRVNAAFLGEIIAVGELRLRLRLQLPEIWICQITYWNIIAVCPKCYGVCLAPLRCPAKCEFDNFFYDLFPFFFFATRGKGHSALEIAFKLFCQLRKRGDWALVLLLLLVLVLLGFRSGGVTGVQFAAKASGNWTKIIIAYFCMRCRFAARRITVIKGEPGKSYGYGRRSTPVLVGSRPDLMKARAHRQANRNRNYIEKPTHVIPCKWSIETIFFICL